jgi:Fic family protein
VLSSQIEGTQSTLADLLRFETEAQSGQPIDDNREVSNYVDVDDCLDVFERFIHETRSQLPRLIKAGLLHVQFETIHPFLDGNGSVGRLLVTLFLCANGVERPCPALISTRAPDGPLTRSPPSCTWTT